MVDGAERYSKPTVRSLSWKPPRFGVAKVPLKEIAVTPATSLNEPRTLAVAPSTWASALNVSDLTVGEISNATCVFSTVRPLRSILPIDRLAEIASGVGVTATATLTSTPRMAPSNASDSPGAIVVTPIVQPEGAT